MRNIFIVGASSSIGIETTKLFLNNGDHVLATYNENDFVMSHNNLIKKQLKLDRFLFDDEIFLSIESLKPLDIVIFLAGILPGKNLFDYTTDEIFNVMNVNFISQAKLIKYLLPYLNDNSHILMMSSISGQRGSFDPIYAASKSAMFGRGTGESRQHKVEK